MGTWELSSHHPDRGENHILVVGRGTTMGLVSEYQEEVTETGPETRSSE